MAYLCWGARASVVVAWEALECRVSSCAHGLSCSEACGIFGTRARTPVPCVGRWILNHCATRDVPDVQLLNFQIMWAIRFSFVLNLCWLGFLSLAAQSPVFFKINLFIYLFIYLLFLAALGLHCCAWAFSSCGEQGLLAGFSLWWLLLLRSTGSRHVGFSSYGVRASVVVACGL